MLDMIVMVKAMVIVIVIVMLMVIVIAMVIVRVRVIAVVVPEIPESIHTIRVAGIIYLPPL